MIATTLSTAWAEVATSLEARGADADTVTATRMAFYAGAASAITAAVEGTPPHAILGEVLAVMEEEGVK